VSDSMSFMVFCFLGGLDYIAGPVVGAFLLTISFEVLQPLQQYQPLIYAMLMIGFMLWLPNGILSLSSWGSEADSHAPKTAAAGISSPTPPGTSSAAPKGEA